MPDADAQIAQQIDPQGGQIDQFSEVEREADEQGNRERDSLGGGYGGASAKKTRLETGINGKSDEFMAEALPRASADFFSNKAQFGYSSGHLRF